MTQIGEPIPTYTLSILLAVFGDGVPDMVYRLQIVYFPDYYFVLVFTNCGKWLG